MEISLEQVRDALSKDDFDYVNVKIARLMSSAKSSLLAAIGFKSGDALPLRGAAEFEELSNTYIVEYVRAMLDNVDNEKQLTVLSVQLEALMHDSVSQGEASHGIDEIR